MKKLMLLLALLLTGIATTVVNAQEVEVKLENIGIVFKPKKMIEVAARETVEIDLCKYADITIHTPLEKDVYFKHEIPNNFVISGKLPAGSVGSYLKGKIPAKVSLDAYAGYYRQNLNDQALCLYTDAACTIDYSQIDVRSPTALFLVEKVTLPTIGFAKAVASVKEPKAGKSIKVKAPIVLSKPLDADLILTLWSDVGDLDVSPIPATITIPANTTKYDIELELRGDDKINTIPKIELGISFPDDRGVQLLTHIVKSKAPERSYDVEQMGTHIISVTDASIPTLIASIEPQAEKPLTAVDSIQTFVIDLDKDGLKSGDDYSNYQVSVKLAGTAIPAVDYDIVSNDVTGDIEDKYYTFVPERGVEKATLKVVYKPQSRTAKPKTLTCSLASYTSTVSGKAAAIDKKSKVSFTIEHLLPRIVVGAPLNATTLCIDLPEGVSKFVGVKGTSMAVVKDTFITLNYGSIATEYVSDDCTYSALDENGNLGVAPIRIYYGRPVWDGAPFELTLRPDRGYFTNAPKIYGLYHDPIKDPSALKKPKRLLLKGAKIKAGSSVNTYRVAFSKLPACYDKKAFKKAISKNEDPVALIGKIQRPLGIEMFLNWQQGKPQEYNSNARPYEDYGVGVAVVVPPELKEDPELLPDGNGATLELKGKYFNDKADVYITGQHSGKKWKAKPKYKDGTFGADGSAVAIYTVSPSDLQKILHGEATAELGPSTFVIVVDMGYGVAVFGDGFDAD